MSVNSFALNIGLNRGENLYQIKRGNNGISRDLAEMIVGKYPELSKAWILTGEGEMFVDDSGRRDNIPFYRMDAADVVDDKRPKPSPSGTLSLSSMLSGCDFAAMSYNKAMEKTIPVGSIVLLERVELDEINPGGEYLINSARFRGIRQISYDPNNETELRLTPSSDDKYGERIIYAREVRDLWLVKGIIIINKP